MTAISKNAETLVTALEALELGAPFAEPVAAAQAAIAELKAAAVAVLFPAAIAPIPADTYAALAFHLARMPSGPMFGTACAELHGRCVHSWPALADLLRAVALPDIAGRAAATAQIFQRPEAEVAAEAVSAFQTAVARQLAGVVDHPLSAVAGALLAAEAFRMRLEAAEARHREHARVELQRAQEQRQAAEQAREAEVGRAARLGIDTFEAAGEVAREQARLAAAAELARQLEASGLTELRMAGALYGVSELRQLAANMSVEQLRRFGAALAAAQKAAA